MHIAVGMHAVSRFVVTYGLRFTIVFFKTLHLQLIRRCNQSLANGRRAKCNVATAYILAMSDHRLL